VGEHDKDLFEGTERFFKPSYNGNLIQSWIPALDGVEAKLKAGAKVADIGCGHGASTIAMAKAYTNSRFYGYDFHEPSIEHGRQVAEEEGLSDRVQFEVASAQDFPGSGYDLVCFFDCLHDMGDPVGAASHTYDALAPNGTAMAVEPAAGENSEDNLNPVGRVFSGFSVLVCTPNALASGGNALGTLATEKQLTEVFRAGGFTSFRKATETPFNRVFEARR
jgi:SAM-dependent methyltransferase